MKVSTILDSIDLGSIALPEFQRGYVWNRDQVRSLMHSLYRRHPVGSLLVWETKTESATTRGDGELASGVVKLLLDGQQRITSLYGIIRGKPPKFFDGNDKAFMGLYFHLDDEGFEFYAPTKMKDNPLWVNVTELMQMGVGEFIPRVMSSPDVQSKLTVYINHLTAVDGIKDMHFHVDHVSGEDKTVDTVVDIFNRVNSGGTKLSKGDLALAKICAQWPDARVEMKQRLEKWHNAGFYLKMELLLRTINAIVTGEALFSALKDVDTAQFRAGLKQAEHCIDRLLNLIDSRLGLDHDRVLGSRYSFPLMVRYLVRRGGSLADAQERDRLLYWYIHTFLWGRYSGMTESTLNQDLEAIEEVTADDPAEGLDRLLSGLRRDRGDLRLSEADFRGSSKGNRFYPMLYMMTRVCHAKDWGTGDELTNFLLGRMSSLQVHHIFPKKLLYDYGYERREVNAIANFTFLTQETNLDVSKRDPAEYIPAYEARHPGAVASHWIPMEPELWKVENYRDFLTERRKLLASAANDFLAKLLAGDVPEPVEERPVAERMAVSVPGGITDEDEEAKLLELNVWVIEQGLPEGELAYELVDEDTNEPLVTIDLAWPDGLQEGRSQPVAVLLDEGEGIEVIVNEAGYRFFTSVEKFKEYVQREILALDEDVT